MPRRRPQFMEGAADVEAAQLNKLSDGDELKFGGCPTQAETDSQVVCVYTNNFKGQDMPRRRPQFMEGAADVEAAQLNKLSDGDELKFGGCPTQAETDS